MANNKGDVELVVKARNDASKSLDTINKALAALVDNQSDLGASSGKLSQSLEQLAKLAATVGNAYGKIQTDSDKAAASLARQESVLNENKAVYQSLVTQMEAAARVQEKLRTKANELAAAQAKLKNAGGDYGPFSGERGKALAAQQAEAARGADAAAVAQEQLRRQAERVGQTVATQETSFRKSFYALQDLAGSSEKAAAALDKVRSAQDRAATASAGAASQQEATAAKAVLSANAAARRSALELRRSMADAASGAEDGWRKSQQAIRDLSQEITKVGVPTAQMVSDNARLATSASVNKAAYIELRNAAEQLTRTLRDERSTVDDVVAAQARARSAMAATQSAMAANATASQREQAASAAAAASAHESARLRQQAADDAARQQQQTAADGARAQQQQAAAARRSALELRRSMMEASTGAADGWRTSQQAIRDLSQEISKVGVPTSQMVADNARLAATASANKAAHLELRNAIELLTRTLRDEKASLQDVAAAQDRARAALAGAQNMMVSAAAASRNVAAGEREVGKAGREAAGGADQLDRSLQSLFANSRRSLSLFQRLRGEVLSLVSSYVGLYAAINGVNQVIQASMSMQAVESRLNVVTGGDPAATAAELQWVKKEADRLGFSLTTLAGEWSKFSVSAQASNFTMDQTRKIFTSVSEAGRVLKLDSQRMELAFTAITQMMSKGTIQMEELRQQLGEHIPGAFALMAQAAGVSGAELTKMMEKGQLTSDYLLKFADVLDKRFGPQLSKSLEMTQAELGRFQTAFTLALNKIADAGVMEAFTKALRELQVLMRSKDAEVWFQRVGGAIGGLINLLLGVLKNVDLIVTALVGLGAAKGAAYVMSLVQGFIALRTAMVAAQGAAAGLSVATAALGGPVGLAIGVLAGAFAFLSTRVKESETAMVSARRVVDDISSAYREGAKSAKEWADALKGMSNLQIERDLAVLKGKLQSELGDIFTPFGRSFMTRARSTNSPLTAVFEEMNQLAEGAKKGEIPLEEFKKRLDAIAEAHPQLRELALRMQDSGTKALETETAVRRFEASIRVMRGEATEADKVLLGLADNTRDLANAQTEGAQAMAKYTEAMDRLAKRIPTLKKELEFEEGLKAVQKDLQAAIDNAGGDEKLKQAALDRAAQAIRALRDGYDEALIKEFTQTKRDGMVTSVNLLKEFEGFRSTPYWDVNAYRVGYGSDTVTLDDGSIKKVTQGITVTQEDALRDLVRRIAEFQEGIKRQVGTERWSAFGQDQQAALTSIAYNYGSLPKRILDAVRHGTSDEIAEAVKGLRNDNKGVNADRRDKEAAILARDSASLAASTAKQIDEREDKVAKVIADLGADLRRNAALSKRDQAIEEALKKATPDPDKPQLTADQTTRIRDAAGKAYDAKEEQSTQQKIATLTQQIAESKAGISREEFIANAARKDGVNLLTDQGKKYAELQGTIYDRENAEKKVNDLIALRKELMDQIAYQQNRGNTEGTVGMQKALDEVNVKLKQAIENAKQFYTAMGGPNADIAKAKLENLSNTIVTQREIILDAKAINQSFAQGLTSAFTSAAEAVAAWLDGSMKGKDVFEALGNAFRKFAADFLIQIAQMIMQQAIFNAISGMFGGGLGGTGGLGGWIAGLVRHDGGMMDTRGTTRMVSPAWFSNAVRYHTGGIAGLAPNEVPAILERNEEVLTRDDPRHILNGGGGGGNVKIVNAIDAGDFVSQGMSTEVGQKAIFNFIRANRSAVKGALG